MSFWRERARAWEMLERGPRTGGSATSTRGARDGLSAPAILRKVAPMRCVTTVVAAALLAFVLAGSARAAVTPPDTCPTGRDACVDRLIVDMTRSVDALG